MSSMLNIQVMNFLSYWCMVITPFTLFEKKLAYKTNARHPRSGM